jgi:hypothetical protein
MRQDLHFSSRDIHCTLVLIKILSVFAEGCDNNFDINVFVDGRNLVMMELPDDLVKRLKPFE